MRVEQAEECVEAFIIWRNCGLGGDRHTDYSLRRSMGQASLRAAMLPRGSISRDSLIAGGWELISGLNGCPIYDPPKAASGERIACREDRPIFCVGDLAEVSTEQIASALERNGFEPQGSYPRERLFGVALRRASVLGTYPAQWTAAERTRVSFEVASLLTV